MTDTMDGLDRLTSDYDVFVASDGAGPTCGRRTSGSAWPAILSEGDPAFQILSGEKSQRSRDVTRIRQFSFVFTRSRGYNILKRVTICY